MLSWVTHPEILSNPYVMWDFFLHCLGFSRCTQVWHYLLKIVFYPVVVIGEFSGTILTELAFKYEFVQGLNGDDVYLTCAAIGVWFFAPVILYIYGTLWYGFIDLLDFIEGPDAGLG